MEIWNCNGDLIELEEKIRTRYGKKIVFYDPVFPEESDPDEEFYHSDRERPRFNVDDANFPKFELYYSKEEPCYEEPISYSSYDEKFPDVGLKPDFKRYSGVWSKDNARLYSSIK